MFDKARTHLGSPLIEFPFLERWSPKSITSLLLPKFRFSKSRIWSNEASLRENQIVVDFSVGWREAKVWLAGAKFGLFQTLDSLKPRIVHH